jgi:hypothetical protein
MYPATAATAISKFPIPIKVNGSPDVTPNSMPPSAPERTRDAAGRSTLRRAEQRGAEIRTCPAHPPVPCRRLPVRAPTGGAGGILSSANLWLPANAPYRL